MQNRLRGRAPDGSMGAPSATRTMPARHARGGRRGLSAFDNESILELQRLAGNAAVAKSLIGSKRDGRVVMGVDAIKLQEKPSPPAGGLKAIRDLKKGAGILGYTIRSIDDWPPILKPESPVQNDKGWTTKARAVSRVPEPEFKEYWPTQGRHAIAKNTFIDIDPDWERKLHVGEDEHVSDTTLAWEVTWKAVAGIINALAKEPGRPQPTAEAATKDLFDRYRRALPEPDLKPEGEQPDEDAQRKVLSPDDGTLFWWMFQTTVVRDTRNYHEPKTAPSEVGGNITVSHLENGDSKIPGPKSDELLKEVRKKFTKGAKIKGT